MAHDDTALQRRTTAIARLGLLERAGDPNLTALTRLAAHITGARAAAIDILDDAGSRRIAATGTPLSEQPREDARVRKENRAGAPRGGHPAWRATVGPVGHGRRAAQCGANVRHCINFVWQAADC